MNPHPHLTDFLLQGPLAAGPNPLDGVTPNLELLGVRFSNMVTLVLGAIWALGLAVIAAAFLWNLTKWGLAGQRGNIDDVEDGSAGAKRSAIAFFGTAIAGIILGALLAVAGML
ncbi:hypothetical protein BLJ79_17880 [Arthrobacter sp. UCD-GKA]|uniref:hypothetical protein n=1 Tax=Arthrobacter sp. UCD-GKA TaxID=1913576 RepID=UPI0008DDB4F8|nr:hypothetical protein [Arthrobacter sp. UCD-GKA]OIH82820.1 hypothetical protein BLJ79_17880 [Arthrobacter sp. UCD-GKA]